MKPGTTLRDTLACVEAPAGLHASVMLRVANAKRRAAQVRTLVFGLCTTLSLVLLIPVLQYTSEQLYASGFYEYLSLIASDRALVLTYWQEFSLSVLESLPSLALLLLLPVVAALVWSATRLVRNVRSAFRFA
jgi:hypothetical protein